MRFRSAAIRTRPAANCLILLAVVFASALGSPSRWDFAEVHMGMPVRLVLYAGDEATARAAAGTAFARIASLDAMLSDYRPDSEVNRLTDSAGSWTHVSRDLFAILGRARDVARATGGAFDPTVGPVVRLWREARATGRLPESDILARARALVDWRHLALDGDRQSARLAVPGMRLDLGGIAKGFILDEARAALASAGVTRVFLEAGGDIVAGDPPPGARGWRVEVPGADVQFATRAAELANAALATSGPTSQFVEIGGIRYSHVVSPFTGLGLTVSAVAHVIAPDAATADALATAIGVIGRDCAGDVLARFPEVIVSEAGDRTMCRALRPPPRVRSD